MTTALDDVAALVVGDSEDALDAAEVSGDDDDSAAEVSDDAAAEVSELVAAADSDDGDVSEVLVSEEEVALVAADEVPVPE